MCAKTVWGGVSASDGSHTHTSGLVSHRRQQRNIANISGESERSLDLDFDCDLLAQFQAAATHTPPPQIHEWRPGGALSYPCKKTLDSGAPCVGIVLVR